MQPTEPDDFSLPPIITPLTLPEAALRAELRRLERAAEIAAQHTDPDRLRREQMQAQQLVELAQLRELLAQLVKQGGVNISSANLNIGEGTTLRDLIIHTFSGRDSNQTQPLPRLRRYRGKS